MNTMQSDTRRKPGRPKKTDEPEQIQRRRRRLAMDGAVAGKLGVHPSMIDSEKYVYRFVNDEQNGRIHNLTQLDDWELVPRVGETGTDLGSMESRIVGTHADGTAKRAYLCRKLKILQEEDDAAQQAAIDEIESQLKGGFDRHGAKQFDYTPRIDRTG